MMMMITMPPLSPPQEIDLDNADLDAQLRAGVEVLKRDLTRGKDATIEISLPSQVTGLNDLHDYKVSVGVCVCVQ